MDRRADSRPAPESQLSSGGPTPSRTRCEAPLSIHGRVPKARYQAAWKVEALGFLVSYNVGPPSYKLVNKPQ